MTLDYTDTAFVSRFDPALGILLQVEGRFEVAIIGQLAFESLDNEPSLVTTSFGANVTLSRPGFAGQLGSVTPDQNLINNVSAFDGTFDFGGTSGLTLPNLATTTTVFFVAPPPVSDLALFQGPAGAPGMIGLPVTASGDTAISGSSNLVFISDQTASWEVDVTYHYALDCNDNGVPDDVDLGLGTENDLNGDGIPDSCSPGVSSCMGDGGDQMGCTDCPCANNAAAGSLGGCRNSSGFGALLFSLGEPSLAADSLRFEVYGAVPSSFGLLVSADNLLPGMGPCPPGSGVSDLSTDGLRCVGGMFLRQGVRATDSSGDIGVSTPGWGAPDGPPGGLLMQGGWSVGQSRSFQVFYREDLALGCGTGANTTNAITLMVEP